MVIFYHAKYEINRSVYDEVLIGFATCISFHTEYRNCTAGTDILLKARGCCNINYPCDEGEGHCKQDTDCKSGLFCGKNNCDKQNFPSRGTRCCQKGK